jgi:prevent-host-death family protein
MKTTKVSIGQVKQDISELVNRVAYGGERIVLTSRGKPKAVLVSIQDFEQLIQPSIEENLSRWSAWQRDSEALTSDIMARRQSEPLDVDQLWQAAKVDLEARDGDIISC